MPVSKKPRKGKSLLFRQVIKKTKIVKMEAQGKPRFVVVSTNEVARVILHKRSPIK